jgi:hypothetical protein
MRVSVLDFRQVEQSMQPCLPTSDDAVQLPRAAPEKMFFAGQWSYFDRFEYVTPPQANRTGTGYPI